MGKLRLFYGSGDDKMASNIATFKERELMSEVELTVTLHIKRDWRVRLGLFLVRAGAWLAGFGLKVED
jgi:hypothetical protein